MNVCLLPPGSASPPLIILRVCIVKCDCECCYTVHICLLYTLALCTLTICVFCCYLFCRVHVDVCTICLFHLFVRVTRIVCYSSTRDLLGLAVAPG